VKHHGAWLIIGLLYFAPLFGTFQISQTARLFSSNDFSSYPWIYQRQEVVKQVEAKPAEIIIVGDILCGRNGNSLGLSLENASAWLQRADLAIGNLECGLFSRRESESRSGQISDIDPYLLFGAPLVGGSLRQAGFDILGLANNHALDLGWAGLADTANYLLQNGIGVIGVRRYGECEVPPVIRQVRSYRIALLAFNAVPQNRKATMSSLQTDLAVESWQESDCFLNRIQAARQESDAVIVLAHWGVEYENRPGFIQKAIAEKLIQSGADLIVGQHPHVPQQVEVYPQPDGQRVSLVAYSLGNFLADQEFGETVHGLGLRVFIDEMGLRSVQALPIQAGPRPRLVDEDQDSSWLAQIMPKPKPIAFLCDNKSCSEIKSSTILPGTDSGLFWSGEIDLTGDGFTEQIQRQAGRVIVYQDGNEAWRSPENWQVVDLALGDPDQDGRQEMMMAFWRADKTGVLRSHPFIVGYRGGTYHETWGGSGVSDPIQELELGDVDGDGIQELVVLEQRSSGKQAVTVWDWHGWGFSLKWRSPEENYQNLNLYRDRTMDKDSIIVLLASS
jgi:hypothetical protein